MTVYIEDVFVSNFVFNFVLLYFTSKISGQRIKKARLIFADIFASGIALILPLFNTSGIVAILLKLVLSVGIVFVLIGRKSKKQFVATLLLFWSLTFGIGGVLVGIYFLTAQDFAVTKDFSVLSSSPLPFYIAGLLLFVCGLKNLLKYIGTKKKNSAFLYDVTISFCGKVFEAKGFLDSGNQLCDSQSNLPVVIVTSTQLKSFFSEKIAQGLVSKTNLPPNFHYINFSTLSDTNQKMMVFCADSIIVDGKKHDVLIGLLQKKVFFGEDCDLLLNAKMSL